MLPEECKCELAGFCNRHQMRKTQREVAICKGKAEGLSCKVMDTYRRSWEGRANAVDPPASGQPVPFTPRVVCKAGTELKKLLSWFGVTEGCNCANHASQMDAKGCAWCEQNIDMIVGWLQEAASKRKILGFSLDKVPGFELTAKALVQKAIKTATAEAPTRKNPFFYDGDLPEFKSLSQMAVDARTLASKLPPDTSRIIGVARSGLTPATLVAQILHLPLDVFRQSAGDLVDGGNGWRLTGNTGGKGPVVVIDDTVMTGNSFKHSVPIIKKTHSEVLTAALYVNPTARVKPDLWVSDLKWPHLLEWNMFNSVPTSHLAFDFDGILCHDCPPHMDDDGPRYLEFLRTTLPLYPVRKIVIPMIVTARLEKYRAETMDWLARHGMAVNELVMGPWATLAERSYKRVIEHKAKHFKRFMALKHPIKPPMFVESEARQAEQIAKSSGGIVVCPAAGRCFRA